MCKITLKKIEAKQRYEDKAPVALNAVSIDLGDLELLLEGKQPLFTEEPFMSVNGTPLFTPVALNLDAEAYPFPMEQHQQLQQQIAQQPIQIQQPIVTPTAEPKEELNDDAFEFKFIPEQYEEEETPDHMDDSEYTLSSGSSAPTSPNSGSDNELISAPIKIFNAFPNPSSSCKMGGLITPNSSPASSPTSGNLPTPSTPASIRHARKKTLHNPQISDEKRERNRLAAEKYRRKGRDLIVTLERKCEELTMDNANLFQKNKCLEDELARLREILMKSGHQ